LSNIYLHKLDQFIETVLIPEYTRGKHRAHNPDHKRLENALRRARGRNDWTRVRDLRKQLRTIPSQDVNDPGYRRLRYCRYADDMLLGFAGPKAEAEQIKQRLTRFCRDTLALELNQDKTLITHARSSAARFLGYEITVRQADTMIGGGRRGVNATIGLRVPTTVIKANCSRYLTHGKPERRTTLQNSSDYDIVRV
jgi:hypothetical protein